MFIVADQLCLGLSSTSIIFFKPFKKIVRIFGAFHSCLFARVCQTHPSHFSRLLKNCPHFRSLSLLSACFKLYGEETGASPVWPWLQPTVQIRIFGGLPGKETAKREKETQKWDGNEEAADNKKMLLPSTGSSTTDAERSVLPFITSSEGSDGLYRRA